MNRTSEPDRIEVTFAIPDDVARVVSVLAGAGFDAYLVGGCVRDLWLGRPPKDFDVATSARPEDVKRLFTNAMLVGAAFGVMLVTTETGRTVEVATFRKDGSYSDHRRPDSVEYSTPAEDSAWRDFTMNALFYDVTSRCVLDYVGGVADLGAGMVVCVGDPMKRFAEDALRLMRACRFAAVLNFQIEPGTLSAIRHLAGDLIHVAVERILHEMDLGLAMPHAAEFIEILDSASLLAYVLPEVVAMKGCTQPPDWHPEGDVYVHTLLVLRNLPVDSPIDLIWAALLHDVGKPATRTETDRIRFLQHADVGAHIAESIGQRLRFPRHRTDAVAHMVRRHMTWGNVPQMRVSTRRRFFASPFIEQELQLHRADSLGSLGTTELYETCRALYAADRESTQTVDLPKGLLSGHDLIAEGLAPGPQFSRLLGDLLDAQMEGRFSTREEALVYMRSLIAQHVTEAGYTSTE